MAKGRRAGLSALLLASALAVSGAASPVKFVRPVDPFAVGRYSNYDPASAQGFQRTSNSFELAADMDLREIRWWGYYEDGRLELAAPFRIQFFTDEGGVPGVLLHEVSLTASLWRYSRPTQAVTSAGAAAMTGEPLHEYRSGQLPSIVLQGHTIYWISIAHAKFPQFLWSRAASRDGGVAYRNLDSEPWTPWPVPAGAEDAAFTLIAQGSAGTGSRPGDVSTGVEALSWARIKVLYAR